MKSARGHSTSVLLFVLVGGCSTIGGIEPGHLSEERGMSEEEIAAAEEGPMIDPTATEPTASGSPTPPPKSPGGGTNKGGNDGGKGPGESDGGRPDSESTSGPAPSPSVPPIPAIDGGAGTCPTGTADCNDDRADGCETFVVFDDANCGVCGRVCGPSESCVNGACF